MRRVTVFFGGLFCAHLMFFSVVQAQTNSYKQTNLVSDTAGLAPVIDPNLVNPWGICIIPGDPFWISDNASPTGVSSLYTNTGAIRGGVHDCSATGQLEPRDTDRLRRQFSRWLSSRRKHEPVHF